MSEVGEKRWVRLRGVAAGSGGREKKDHVGDEECIDGSWIQMGSPLRALHTCAPVTQQ